jgi:hypothetical protein
MKEPGLSDPGSSHIPEFPRRPLLGNRVNKETTLFS